MLNMNLETIEVSLELGLETRYSNYLGHIFISLSQNV